MHTYYSGLDMLTYCSGLDMLTCCSGIDMLTYCSGSDMLTCCNVQGYTVYDHLFFRVRYAHLFFRVIYIYICSLIVTIQVQYLGSADIQLLDSDSRVEYVTLQGKPRRYQLPLVMILHCSMSHQPFAWMIICDTGTTYLKHVSYYIIHTHTYLQSQNNR